LFLLILPLTSVRAQEAEKAISSDALALDSAATLIAPLPVPSVTAKDKPNDGGGTIIVTWELSPDDTGDSSLVTGYYILRSTNPDGPFDTVATETRGKTVSEDGNVQNGVTYYYRVDAVHAYQLNGEKLAVAAPAVVTDSARPSAQWFNMARLVCLLLTLFVGGSIIYFIRKATRGESMYVRKIGGIEAVEEAVGRATEMGRKIFYVPGIQDMNDVQTIAGIAILGRVAEKAAEYETWLEVPVCRSMVMVTARETMREAYTRIGRPDNFREAQVHYLTDDQFGYAAAIDGMVVREKPATIFYMGAFFAESLILAETGNSVGAIQIAGTAMPAQLPFFVAACDYTLIGEELFAASAYLSREPRQLGSLKGQDVGKALFLLLIIIGVILATVGWYNLAPLIKVG
jgi:hypothetical protein